MDFREQKGFAGSDIIISVIILFIFVSLISTMFYNFNISGKEVERRSEAVNIAVSEIEQIKINGFSQLINNDISCEKKAVDEKDGYYKTITVEDYADVNTNETKQRDVVKKVNVKITYKFKNQEQNVELSTILSKEN